MIRTAVAAATLVFAVATPSFAEDCVREGYVTTVTPYADSYQAPANTYGVTAMRAAAMAIAAIASPRATTATTAATATMAFVATTEKRNNT